MIAEFSTSESPGASEDQNLAERQGFEPWEGYPSTVFKTVGAITRNSCLII
jgi:hypothetical protein